jgi:hypothetical protein
MRAFISILSVATVLLSGCGDGVRDTTSTDSASGPLSFYVVSEEKLEGGRFIDMADFPKLGYIAAKPDLVVMNLEAVHPDVTPRRDVFVDENGKKTPVPVNERASLIIRMLPDDAKQFTMLTEKAVGKKVLIMLGDTPLTAPMIPRPISNQNIGLNMGFGKKKEMKEIETRLKKLVR